MIYFDNELKQFSSIEDREFGLTTKAGAGAAIGAGIGSVVPVVGTGIGAAVGAGVGATSHALKELKARRREKALAKATGKLADMHMEKWNKRMDDNAENRESKRNFILRKREINSNRISEGRKYLLDKQAASNQHREHLVDRGLDHIESMKDKRNEDRRDMRRSSYLHRKRD
jgi:flavin-dependent dehydrogenase